MKSNEKDFQESNIDPEKLSQSIHDFVKNDSAINVNSEEELKTLIAKIEKYILSTYEVRLNSVLNIIEVKRIGIDIDFHKDEKFESNLSVDLYHKGFKDFKNVLTSLLGSSFIQEYHPIQDYFENLQEWDGSDHIGNLISCVECKNKIDQIALSNQFRMHLLRCVASVFRPGFFNKQCFVLVGTRQNMGKTTFIRYLVPNALKSYLTDAILDWKNKDAEIALGSNWIINLDELANLDKEETNSLKATLSRNKIKLRRPFGKIETEIPRLANFFGSTNDLLFLGDLTGNVRWVCFRISNIDFSYNKIDIDQFWAQAYYEYKKGNKYDLDRKDVQENEIRNEEFMVINQECDAIRKHFIAAEKNGIHPELKIKAQFASAGELMKILNSNSYNFKSEVKMGKALIACGFERTSERVKHQSHPIRGYWFYEFESKVMNDEIE